MKTCALKGCNNKFDPGPTRKKFCSDECRNKSYKSKKHKHICGICKKEFESGRKKQDNCRSRKCLNKYRRDWRVKKREEQREIKVCQYHKCDKELTGGQKKYCCRSHRQRAYENRVKGIGIIYCRKCNRAHFPDSTNAKTCNDPFCKKEMKFCEVDGCSEIITGKKKYCQKHKEESLDKRKKFIAEYNKGWIKKNKKPSEKNVKICKCGAEFEPKSGARKSKMCEECAGVEAAEVEKKRNIFKCGRCGNWFKSRKGPGGRDICLSCKQIQNEEKEEEKKSKKGEIVIRKNTAQENKWIAEFEAKRGK